MADPKLRCVDIGPEHWPDIETLFGESGACGGCWCMWWRVPRGGALWERTKGAPAKRAFRRLVKAGRVGGILAYAADQPVGWCGFGPRRDFPRVNRVRALADPDQPGAAIAPADAIYSINCFYIPRAWRGRGVSQALLDAALRACRRRRARIAEGYPVTPTTDGRPLPAAFAWTGPLSIFEERGFRAVRDEPASRTLVRLRLRR